MSKITRRTAIGLFAAGATSVTLPMARPNLFGRPDGPVLVIGGGPGGVAAALDVKRRNPDRDVTLVERDPSRLSKRQGGQLFSLASEAPKFHLLKKEGVQIAVDEIANIDWNGRVAKGRSGRRFAFGNVVIAPGVAPRSEDIEGYGREASYEWPHAWFGTVQARRLAARLQAMEDGGTFVIRVPAGAMRYPRGPYERAAQIGKYFVREKPRSKILVLDAKDHFPEQSEFFQQWQAALPPGMVEWVPGSKGGNVDRVDVRTGQLFSNDACFKADVVNFIPAQQAGEIAVNAGVAGADGWCPVSSETYRSSLQDSAFIIGDAVSSQETKTGRNAVCQAEALAQSMAPDIAS